MFTAPVLTMPDFNVELIVENDASSLRVGTVLTQKGRLMTYFSKALGL